MCGGIRNNTGCGLGLGKQETLSSSADINCLIFASVSRSWTRSTKVSWRSSVARRRLPGRAIQHGGNTQILYGEIHKYYMEEYTNTIWRNTQILYWGIHKYYIEEYTNTIWRNTQIQHWGIHKYNYRSEKYNKLSLGCCLTLDDCRSSVCPLWSMLLGEVMTTLI